MHSSTKTTGALFIVLTLFRWCHPWREVEAQKFWKVLTSAGPSSGETPPSSSSPPAPLEARLWFW